MNPLTGRSGLNANLLGLTTSWCHAVRKEKHRKVPFFLAYSLEAWKNEAIKSMLTEEEVDGSPCWWNSNMGSTRPATFDNHDPGRGTSITQCTVISISDREYRSMDSIMSRDCCVRVAWTAEKTMPTAHYFSFSHPALLYSLTLSIDYCCCNITSQKQKTAEA